MGETLLHLAAGYQGTPEMVARLLEAGADPNAAKTSGRQSPMHIAAFRSTSEILKLPLASPEINIEAKDDIDRTPIFFALNLNIIPADNLILLIASGADIEARDAYGNTPLQTAVGEGSFEAVKILMKAGANIHNQNDKGYSVLHTAAMQAGYNDRMDMYEALIKAGAKADVKTNDGYTTAEILQKAIERKKAEAAK